MAFYFPDYAQNTIYSPLYAQLSAVERGMVLREFIGVTYRRRFQFFRRHHFHQPYRAFKNNLHLAAQRQDKKFQLSPRVWRKKKQLPASLELIFRHYILGFVAQMLAKQHHGELKEEEGCYPKAPLMLAALEWFVAHEQEVTVVIEQQVQQVMEEDCRSVYLYCLRAFLAARKLADAPALQHAARKSVASRVGGEVPLGAELEFSNLGYRAAFEHSFGRHQHDHPYCNFIYFHQFFLEDITWRLGGYLDHHVRLRRYLPVPWIGGFFEYNLVRIDYPRRFSLPLTRDSGFLARYIQLVVQFNHRVAPHSLHLNVECLPAVGAQRTPTLADYMCLLLLGGDLAQDESGAWQEQRLGQNELIKMLRQRNHLSLFDHQRHLVTEFAFLRLSAQRDYTRWHCLILAMVGLNRVTNFGQYCLEAMDDLLQWAHCPKAVSPEAVDSFVEKVRCGLELDSSLPRDVSQQKLHQLRLWLEQQNAKISMKLAIPAVFCLSYCGW